MPSLEKALRHYKAEHDVTYQDIASALGMDQSTLIRKRRGTSAFGATELRNLAQMLGSSMDEVYSLLPEAQVS